MLTDDNGDDVSEDSSLHKLRSENKDEEKEKCNFNVQTGHESVSLPPHLDQL
jgi:hypothetical protein